MDSLIIGIAGGSGSGKSTFTNRIKEILEMMLWCFTMTITTADKMEFPLKRE